MLRAVSSLAATVFPQESAWSGPSPSSRVISENQVRIVPLEIQAATRGGTLTVNDHELYLDALPRLVHVKGNGGQERRHAAVVALNFRGREFPDARHLAGERGV